jgi:hypothetical protein
MCWRDDQTKLQEFSAVDRDSHKSPLRGPRSDVGADSTQEEWARARMEGGRSRYVEVKKKTQLQRLEFFLLRSPLDGARSVLTYRTRCSVAGQCDPVDWGFLYQRFSSLVRNEACQFRKQQSRTAVQLPTIVLSGTRGT